MPELSGSPTGKGRRFAILASRFNEPITSKLLDGAVDALKRHGVVDDDIDVTWVPGAWELRGQQNLDRVATQIWDDLSVAPDERRIAGLLLRTAEQRLEEIDTQLANVTTNWRLERLGVIERSVLRLAAAELQRGETPP